MTNPTAHSTTTTDAPDAQPATTLDLKQPALYVNRELSWLAFNERVLDQAALERWPLLERLKFVAIHASNLDEFFMIRVSGLHEQLEAVMIEPSPDGLGPRQQLDRIGEIVRRQVARSSALLRETLLPALAEHGVRVVTWSQLSADAKRAARRYFRRAVFPVLTPLAVDPGHPFPFLSNLSLSLAVEARDPETKQRKFARVKVPESLPRFIPLASIEPERDGAGAREFLLLEELIASNLEDLFPGMDVIGCHPFRVTRDMDLSILEEEADDLLSAIDREVRRRRFGACVRLEVATGIPDRVRQLLTSKLEIDDEDVYEGPGPLGASAWMALATLPVPELRDPPLVPRVPPELAEGSDLFAAIRARDVLLHHPYESFTPVLEFLRQAADDPAVLAIKMTLYRAGSNAEAVRALARAAENGKQVAASIELKARFDEENNIAWARMLERVGAHVFFGDAALKIHAKLVLVVRQEKDGLRRYVHLSTGNYNASTARLYTDCGMFTSAPDIGEDASELFNSLSGFSKRVDTRKLAVAPGKLASTVLDKIEQQAARARDGKSARIFAKLNALVDPEIIAALYRASNAGVSIDLCVRGVCCLRPGVPGVSENIRVFSIIGRFLEHERVLIFGPDGEDEVFLSSADWMPRNFRRRVEIMFPIEDPRLRHRIVDGILGVTLMDNVKARILQPDGSYVRATPRPGEPVIRSQVEFQNMARELSTDDRLRTTAVPPPAATNPRPARAVSV
jgi:polyphosphate kinase